MKQSVLTPKSANPCLSTSDIFFSKFFKIEELSQDKFSRLIFIKILDTRLFFRNESANAMNGQFLFKVKLNVSHFKKKTAYHGHNSKVSSGTEVNLLQRNSSLQFKTGKRKE